MKAPEFLDEARTPAGELIRLTRESGDLVVRVDGVLLMSSGAHHSEELMSQVGCRGLREKRGARVLVGGLGLGYTLRAALDEVGPDATVVVSELLDAVVTWNRGVLAPLAGHPLDDPRTEVEVGDLVAYMQSRPEPFDALLFDVDCGPDSFTSKGNGRLYDPRGLAMLRAALRPGGVLVVWSAYECPPFVQDLKRAGFAPEVVVARARGDRGPRHTLYVGRKVGDATQPGRQPHRRNDRPPRGRRRR